MSDVVNFEGGCGYPGNSHRSEAEASKEQEKKHKNTFKKEINKWDETALLRRYSPFRCLKKSFD